MIKLVGYAEEVVNNSDLFLAVELSGLHNKLDSQMNNMQPFTMAEDLAVYYNGILSVPYYDSANGWENFISIYNEAVEASEQGLINNISYFDYYEKTRTAYIEYMDEAVANGYNFSHLQNYGDINNDSKIDINDVTYLQNILAEAVSDDFYSHYNSDVNGDEVIDVLDVTAIQEYLCGLDDHFAVYDNDFNGIDNYDDTISKEDAEKYLSDALQTAEEWENFPYINMSEDVDVIKTKMIYRDGKLALENADSFKPYELLFKARNMLQCFQGGGKG